jgi:ribosomal protein S12 methylthiotransferase accessory factor
MQPHAPRIACLSDAFSNPPFFGEPVLAVARLLATSLLHVARVPHKYALCHTASGSSAHQRTGPLVRADGVDLASASASLTRCLFELLERTWSPDVNVAGLTYKRRGELDDIALDPRRFVLLSEDEHGGTKNYVRYSDDRKFHWAECWRLSCANRKFEPALVPAVFVYPGFAARCPEERIAPMLSTGIAAGTRYDEALLRGLCEVVERDAFSIAWLCGSSPPRVPVRPSCLGSSAFSVIDDLEADRFEVRLFDLTLDIDIPVAMAAITDQRKGQSPQTTLGLGCSPWPTQALEKALAEALQQMTNRYDFPGGIDVTTRPVASTISPPQQAAHRDALARLLGGRAVSQRFDVPAAEPNPARTPEMLTKCLKQIDERGFSAFFCDLTPAAAEGHRFCLVRTLVPGLQPHLYEPDCWRLAGERLYQAAEFLGRSLNGEADVNKVLNPLAWDVLL